MRSVLLTVGACAVVLAVGCQDTRVAGVHPSQEEEAWEKVIRRNYPNYRPPRAAAPAVVGNTEDRVSAQVKSDLEPMDAPAEKTDAEPKEEPNAEPKDAPAAEPETSAPAVADAPAAGKSEPKAEAKEAPKADAKEAPKTDAKEAPKAEPGKTAPPDPTNSTVYEVRSGDTLGKISQKHYGSARHANVIFKANGDILKDPNRLRPGMKLIIPKL